VTPRGSGDGDTNPARFLKIANREGCLEEGKDTDCLTKGFMSSKQRSAEFVGRRLGSSHEARITNYRFPHTVFGAAKLCARTRAMAPMREGRTWSVDGNILVFSSRSGETRRAQAVRMSCSTRSQASAMVP